MNAVRFSFCFLGTVLVISLFFSEAGLGAFPQDDETRKMFRQQELEDEGRLLLKEKRYEEALEKFKQDNDPALKTKYYQDTVAEALIRRAYWMQNRFEDALENLKPLVQAKPDHQPWVDEHSELLALIESRDTHSPEPVYQHIEYLKEKYKDQLPPNTGAYDDIVASAIIRLYDHVADFDAGVAFAEGFLKRCASGKSCRGDDKKLAYTPKHPYFQIKQAFLEDKAEGFKGCLNAKPSQSEGGQATPQDFGGQAGEACMGRATQALIESDYFPW